LRDFINMAALGRLFQLEVLMSNKAPRRRLKAFSEEDIVSFLGHPVPWERPDADDTNHVLADSEDPSSTDVGDPVAEPAYLYPPRLRFIPDK
jgi:hypothetical protein